MTLYREIRLRIRLQSLVFSLSALTVLVGCAAPRKTPVWQVPGAPVAARAEILSIHRNASAPARFYGRVRIKEPLSYRNLETECFLLSFERDLSAFEHQTIEVQTHQGTLERQLRPPVDFFGGDSTPRLAAEFRQNRFQEIDDARYESPVAVRGRIESYHPDPGNKIFYVIFDEMFSGDLVTLVVETPERYRGTKISLLNEDDSSKMPNRWSQLGARVEFETSEFTLAWEPWGFTRIAELKNVNFPAGQTK